MLTVLLRATILFLSAVFVVRLMGKRQVGQLQPYELVIAIMIAELAATPMEDVGVPLLYGIVPMLTLLILHSAFSVACVKNQRLREFLNGMPSAAEWTNRLGQLKTWLKARADWIDSNYLPPPVFNQDGHLVGQLLHLLKIDAARIEACLQHRLFLAQALHELRLRAHHVMQRRVCRAQQLAFLGTHRMVAQLA